MAELHISISAEPIFNLGSYEFTNSMLVSVLVSIFLITLAIAFSKNHRKANPPKFVAVIQTLIESLYEFVTSITPHHAGQFFPLIATIFLFVMFGNWVGLLPGMETIGINKLVDGQVRYVPLLRGATADLNTTLAMALFAVGAVQILGYKNLGTKYFSKFLNFSNPINFFVGLLEILAELSRVMSFAFRLFGNIFAGEVLLAVIAFLIPVVASLPFFGLEIFVGFIQALVFATLTLVFANIASSDHH